MAAFLAVFFLVVFLAVFFFATFLVAFLAVLRAFFLVAMFSDIDFVFIKISTAIFLKKIFQENICLLLIITHKKFFYSEKYFFVWIIQKNIF